MENFLFTLSCYLCLLKNEAIVLIRFSLPLRVESLTLKTSYHENVPNII